ncbi:hypothetical protein Ctob_010627 [Chrysochromulina tobinii]|uniref:Complex 1 LYR protein domain-containing protein n=1 Tax=Chrysochromulina tobinii TaxID=1460289 RepID=A0A0M0JZS2_9EUKA|nr:hypothetical protein Ctob_010627 [Chrysochromulina tobinii]|eukprot:KOO31628.1 hypothetical protein Ctob_010627 [Chrysochromulina sp. CCMP291]
MAASSTTSPAEATSAESTWGSGFGGMSVVAAAFAALSVPAVLSGRASVAKQSLGHRLEVLMLYKRILRTCQSWPSVKKAEVAASIRDEFRTNASESFVESVVTGARWRGASMQWPGSALGSIGSRLREQAAELREQAAAAASLAAENAKGLREDAIEKAKSLREDAAEVAKVAALQASRLSEGVESARHLVQDARASVGQILDDNDKVEDLLRSKNQRILDLEREWRARSEELETLKQRTVVKFKAMSAEKAALEERLRGAATR